METSEHKRIAYYPSQKCEARKNIMSCWHLFEVSRGSSLYYKLFFGTNESDFLVENSWIKESITSDWILSSRNS